MPVQALDARQQVVANLDSAYPSEVKQ